MVRYCSHALLLSMAALLGCAGEVSFDDLGLVGEELIVDGANGAEAPLYFLPPIASEREFEGVFDATLSPEVVVCRTEAGECTEEVVRFDSNGQGTDSVRVDEEAEHYIVNFHTGRYDLDLTEAYRIVVELDGVALGFADIGFVTWSETLGDGVVTLQLGQTLPIKFRIEEMATCGNGIIETGEECDPEDWLAAPCDPDCMFPECGDGYVNEAAGEWCEPEIDPDCTSMCLPFLRSIQSLDIVEYSREPSWVTLQILATYAHGPVVNVAISEPGVKVGSSDPGIASYFGNGLVLFHQPGTVTITAIFWGTSASITLTGTEGSGVPPPESDITALWIEPDSATISPFEFCQFGVYANWPPHGTVRLFNTPGITFGVSHRSVVAAIDPDAGVVLGSRPGTTTVDVVFKGYAASATLTVSE